jgi:hypothetical protein
MKKSAGRASTQRMGACVVDPPSGDRIAPMIRRWTLCDKEL